MPSEGLSKPLSARLIKSKEEAAAACADHHSESQIILDKPCPFSLQLDVVVCGYQLPGVQKAPKLAPNYMHVASADVSDACVPQSH